MILTSNFKIAGHLPQAVAISRSTSKAWRGKSYKPLAPTWNLVKISDPTEFIRLYRAKVLNNLDPRQVLLELGGDDIVMLCWEAPGEFCHRLVVAAWLQKEVGVVVEELNPKLRRHQDWLKTMGVRER
ncbi:DUF488 family protein, N3 subclade [Desulfobacca acetoxidans]